MSATIESFGPHHTGPDRWPLRRIAVAHPAPLIHDAQITSNQPKVLEADQWVAIQSNIYGSHEEAEAVARTRARGFTRPLK